MPIRLGVSCAQAPYRWLDHPIYASVYLAVPLALAFARTCRDLRRFAVVGLCGTAIGMLTYLAVPIVAPPRDFEPVGLWGCLLEWERADGLAGRAALPSFHVFWTVLSAWLVARRLRSTHSRVIAALGPAVAWLWAAAVIVACATTGMHAIVDLIAGVVLVALAALCPAGWNAARGVAERIANSWCEWRLGPVRIINHGFYAGTAAATGMLIAGALVDSSRLGWLAALMAASLIGAGIWGQIVVGSRTLLRPYGYFGSVVGIASIIGAAALLDVELWAHTAAIAVAAPWVQAIGRLRCLVQGCCHGAPIDGPHAGIVGIRYRHERSRVCRIARLDGVAVHPTPLYSIIGNAVIGVLVARLWIVGAPATFVIGGYLLLSGLARFVEEAFRGEPQTPVRLGLRLYQWLAIAMAITGALVLCVTPPVVERHDPALTIATLAVATAVFALHFVAMGVDFPESKRRFSRLV